jgi:hypothetical protein
VEGKWVEAHLAGRALWKKLFLRLFVLFGILGYRVLAGPHSVSWGTPSANHVDDLSHAADERGAIVLL